MKKEILFVLIIFSISIVAGQEGLSPSQQTDVSVIIDSAFPVITILSPQSTTYSNTTPLLVNFSVSELTLDSTWYSLDDGLTNITASSPFNLELAEGNYNLIIFANDSFNRVNSSQVGFSINNSIIFCGNNLCDVGESCSTCSNDCGSCPAPTSSGGGGGGGSSSTTTKVKNFGLDPDKLIVSLKQGETKQKAITITNTESQRLSFTLSFPNLEDLIRISERSFSLNPKETKVIILDFIVAQNTLPDLYLNRLVVDAKDLKKEVLVAIEVESLKPLFDIKAEIPKQFLEIGPGEEILANINLFNLGDEGRKDIKIEYFVKNGGSEKILTEVETVALETQASFVKSFKIPSDAHPGTYIFYTRATYDEATASASAWFRVKNQFPLLLILLIAFIILLIIIILVLIIRKRKHKRSKSKKKRRKH